LGNSFLPYKVSINLGAYQVSFLVPSQILETIEDIRSEEDNASRSSIIRKLMNMGLNDYYQNKRNNLVKKQ
tara:strand:+ start:379 stop:591 length:213 start_codon:yes stop_codon:yes gene_type:complete